MVENIKKLDITNIGHLVVNFIDDSSNIIGFTDHGKIKNKGIPIRDEMCDSDEEDEIKDVLLEKEIVVNDSSSLITNKYIEDINSNTVANKFSDIVISLENLLSDEIEENLNPDLEGEIYVEDEVYVSDDDEDDDDELLESLPFE